MATKKRKPTPAQLAARERFAEMARSGAFKKAGGRKANPVGNLANLKKRYQTLLLTMADLRDDLKGRKKGLPDDEFAQGYSDAELSALIAKYQTKAQDLREAIAMYEGQRKTNPAPTGGTWLVHLVGKPQSWYATKGSKSAAARLANMLNRQEGRIKYEVSEADWSRKTNPTKKTVSQKISQLTREGYPQRQAVAIALNEERAGKVRRNPASTAPFKFVCIAPLEYSGSKYGIDERTPVTLKFAKTEPAASTVYACYQLPASVVKNDDFQNFAYHNKVLYMSIAQLRAVLKGYAK